jgi:hypothetical protein
VNYPAICVDVGSKISGQITRVVGAQWIRGRRRNCLRSSRAQTIHYKGNRNRLAVCSFTPELLRLLGQARCYLVRPGEGDHSIWYLPITKLHFMVDSKIKSRHTANAVLKQAGLPKQF